jgi:hypothetical protein
MRTAKEAHSNGKQSRPIVNLPPEGELPPLCACSCEQSVIWNQRKNRWNKYVEGHYRKDALYKNKEWLYDAYVIQKRTLQDIARQFDIYHGTIRKFMKKFAIPARNDSESHIGRQAGANNPAWKGGVTPERQRLYKTQEWKQLVKAVYKRDEYCCQRCGAEHKGGNEFNAHHLKSWADHPELRFTLSNLITLCDACHDWVHSNANVGKVLIE